VALFSVDLPVWRSGNMPNCVGTNLRMAIDRRQQRKLLRHDHLRFFFVLGTLSYRQRSSGVPFPVAVEPPTG
jgi:hypothetical protein